MPTYKPVIDISLKELLEKFKEIVNTSCFDFDVKFYDKDLQLNLGEITFRFTDKDYFIIPFPCKSEPIEQDMLLFINDKSRYIDISIVPFIYDITQEYNIKYIIKKLIRIYVNKVFK